MAEIRGAKRLAMRPFQEPCEPRKQDQGGSGEERLAAVDVIDQGVRHNASVACEAQIQLSSPQTEPTTDRRGSRESVKWPCVIPGGRGSVRAGKGHRGSAGASPSQNLGHRTWEGEAPSEPAKAYRGSAGASPSQNLGHRTREGEAPSEPAKAFAAQQELRPPKTWATEPGRARLRPSRIILRLVGSFALPDVAQMALRLSLPDDCRVKQTPIGLSY